MRRFDLSLSAALAVALALPVAPAHAAPAAKPASAPAPAPDAEPDWASTFAPAAVGAHLGDKKPNLIVVGGNAASDPAAAALRAALSATKKTGVLIDGQGIGALDGLDDRAILDRAKVLPVQQIAVVRVFEAGPGEMPSYVVMFYNTDGSVAAALTGSAGTPLTRSAEPVASAGVTTEAADTIAKIEDESEKAGEVDETAQAKFDAEYLWIYTIHGINMQTGAVVQSWTSIRQGEDGRFVRGKELYEILGRDDLVKKYKRRQAIRFGVGGGSAALGLGLLIGGLTAMVVSVGRETTIDFGYDDPIGMNTAKLDSGLGIVGASVMAGVGSVLMTGGFIFMGAFRPHPVSRDEASGLIRKYNADLRKKLGLPAERKTSLRLAPALGRSNGLMLTGQF